MNEPKPHALWAKRTIARGHAVLEKAGLVASEARADDARVRDVCLTDAGNILLAEAREITAPIYAGVIAGFSAADFDRLLGLIGRLQENLDSLHSDIEPG